MIENALQSYNKVIEKILPVLQKRSKISYIGVAVFLAIIQRIYAILRVPKDLRRFPEVTPLSMIRSLYVNEPIVNRTKRLVTPLTNAGHGFYVSKYPAVWTVFVTDPLAARMLLMKTDNFPKSNAVFNAIGDESPAVQFMGRYNVAVSNGQVWRRQRKIMNPAFHRSLPVKTFSSRMPILFNLIDQDGDNVPVVSRMRNFTLDALGSAVFDFDFQSMTGDSDGWTKTYDIIIDSLFDPWVNVFSKVDFLVQYISAKRRRVLKATAEFNSMIDNLINKRRQEILSGVKSDTPENEKDLLTLMIEADLREGTETSTLELRQNVAVFFLAGHDTTAHTLTFCLYNLAKNKHVQRKAREEVLHILGDEPEDVFPSLEELKQMKYIDMVLKENLRRSGPADMLMARDTLEDFDLAGTFIPKGTRVSVDISAIHMNPKIWQNPENFVPERFEEGGEHEDHNGLTWLPFSDGSRRCIGVNFSLTEQRVVLSMLLKRYEIDISKDSMHYDHIVYDKAINFAPNSLQLKFTKRY